MALTKCRDCGDQVSTEAPSCPHCGAPRPASVPAEASPAISSPAVGNVQQVLVVSTAKSVGVSILLTVLFGPLGMLYSTIAGAVIMAILSVIIAVFTLGFGLFITWPVSIIWGAIAASSHNKRLVTGAASRPVLPSNQEFHAPTTAGVPAANPGLPAAGRSRRQTKLVTPSRAIGVLALVMVVAAGAVYLNSRSPFVGTWRVYSCETDCEPHFPYRVTGVEGGKFRLERGVFLPDGTALFGEDTVSLRLVNGRLEGEGTVTDGGTRYPAKITVEMEAGGLLAFREKWDGGPLAIRTHHGPRSR